MANKKKSKQKKIAFLVLLSIIVMLGAHTLFLSSNRLETIVAQEFTHTISFRSRGLVFRDETATDYQKQFGNNVMAEYIKQNGEHVEQNEPLLKLYKTGSNIMSINKLNYLNTKRDLLTDLNEHANNFYSSADVLTASPADLLIKLTKNINNMNLIDTYEAELNLTTLLNKKRLAAGKDKNYNKTIQSLEKEIQKYQVNTSNAIATYVSQNAGCFFNEIDGYENKLNVKPIINSAEDDNNLQRIYTQMEQNFLNNKIINTYGIKIIKDYDWYVILPTNETNANNIVKYNKSVTLNFGFSGGQEIPAQLIKVIPTKDDTKKILIFRSNYMNSNLAKIRMPQITVCTEKIRGILCPVSAVRFINGQKGVFVKEGNLIIFKKLKPIYEDKKILISQISPGNQEYLERLDEVVTFSNEPLKNKVVSSA
ncbi:MAG: hypothetical protein IJC97_01930 [Oscillospiraceae bacterium]|nr:hypothetical protein [Oscillospiraceae bacterium]